MDGLGADLLQSYGSSRSCVRLALTILPGRHVSFPESPCPMRIYRIHAVAGLLLLLALSHPAPSHAATPAAGADGPVLLENLPQVKARQREIVNEGARRIREAREHERNA